MVNSSRKIIAETSWAFAGKGVAFVGFYLLQLLLIRSLSVEDWGNWSVFIAVFTIVLMTSDLGLNIAAKRYIAESASGDHVEAVLRATLLLRLIGNGLFLLVYVAAVYFLVPDGETRDLLILATPVVLLFSFIEFSKSAFEALHDLKQVFIVTMSEHLSRVGFVALFVGLGLTGILWGYVITAVFTAAVVAVLFFLWVRRQQGSDSSLPAAFTLKDVIAYSVPLFVIMLGSFILLEIDVIMLNLLKGDFETGIYATAKQLIVYLPHISIALCMGVMPLFAQLDDTNRAELNGRFTRLTRQNILIVTTVSVVLCAGAAFLLPVVYGEVYEASLAPLFLLIPFVLFMADAACTNSLLDYTGHAVWRMVNLMVTLTCNIVLNYLLIPKYGAEGAAMATSLSMLPFFILSRVQARRVLRGVN